MSFAIKIEANIEDLFNKSRNTNFYIHIYWDITMKKNEEKDKKFYEIKKMNAKL